MNAETRFWNRVMVDDGCWEYDGYHNRDGYVRIMVNCKRLMAHRYAYELLRTGIPEDLVIDHVCCNPGCVNPWHLEPVTQRDNVLRGTAPAAQRARQTHCIHGHPFDEHNTYWNGRRRQCRQCTYDSHRRSLATV